MLRYIILIITGLIFTGCFTHTSEPINPSKSSSYPVLYEVNYDLECNLIGFFHKISFKKGDLLEPLDVGGRTVLFQEEKNVLPQQSIALFFHSNAFYHFYAMIYPDGNFVSDSNFAMIDKDPLSLNTGQFTTREINQCNLINEEPLFKLIENK